MSSGFGSCEWYVEDCLNGGAEGEFTQEEEVEEELGRSKVLSHWVERQGGG